MRLPLMLMAAAVLAAGEPDEEPIVILPDPLDASSDDGIAVFAHPTPYEAVPYQPPRQQQLQPQQYPEYLRFGSLQQALGSKFQGGYSPPINSAGGGLFNFGNKFHPQFPSGINPPNVVGSFSNWVNSYWGRVQQFLGTANQGVQQILSAAQNFKDTYKYPYSPPQQSIWSSILQHKYPGYQLRQSLSSHAEGDGVNPEQQVMPVYQVIAVVPLHNSPPIRVSDLLRQRAMNVDKMAPPAAAQPGVPRRETVEGEGVEEAVQTAIQKELIREMSADAADEGSSVVVNQGDIEHFAKDVAQEVASVIRAASDKPGKISEVVVKVDAAGADGEGDDESDEEAVGDVARKSEAKEASVARRPVVVSKEGVAKRPTVEDDDDSDEDSSDSSESSAETTPPKKETKLPPKKVAPASADEKDDSSDSSDESSEETPPPKAASYGARPARTELEYVLMKDHAGRTKH